MSPTPEPGPSLNDLAGLFYASLAELGRFEQTTAELTPEPYRTLLAHNAHMTVTVEQFHGCKVDVEVLASRKDGLFYSRKILLRRQSDNAVVQFGLVRLNTRFVSDEVRQEIERQQTPLGRVLIEHNVLREVQLRGLFLVHCGADLAHYLAVPPGGAVYGRTALIYCDGDPAVELLEIVTLPA